MKICPVLVPTGQTGQTGQILDLFIVHLSRSGCLSIYFYKTTTKGLVLWSKIELDKLDKNLDICPLFNVQFGLKVDNLSTFLCPHLEKTGQI